MVSIIFRLQEGNVSLGVYSVLFPVYKKEQSYPAWNLPSYLTGNSKLQVHLVKFPDGLVSTCTIFMLNQVCIWKLLDLFKRYSRGVGEGFVITHWNKKSKALYSQPMGLETHSVTNNKVRGHLRTSEEKHKKSYKHHISRYSRMEWWRCSIGWHFATAHTACAHQTEGTGIAQNYFSAKNHRTYVLLDLMQHAVLNIYSSIVEDMKTFW